MGSGWHEGDSEDAKMPRRRTIRIRNELRWGGLSRRQLDLETRDGAGRRERGRVRVGH